MPDSARGFQQQMEAWLPDFMADLAWLTARDRGYMHKPGVDEAAAWMQGRLAALGCAVQVFPGETTGPVVAGTLAGRGRGRYLLLAHLDTVWPAGTAEGWPLRVSEDRASGPGVVDNGGGCLTGYYVLRLLQQAGCEGFEAVTLACSGDEESGSLFSAGALRQLARGCDAALCLEAPPQPDEIVSSRAGSMGFRLKVAGRRAHSQANLDKGANAILEMAHKVTAAHAIPLKDAAMSISAATIEGGPQSGMVPDRAEAFFDVTFAAMEDIEYVQARMREVAERVWVPGTAAQVESVVYHFPMERLPRTAWLADLAVTVGRDLGLALRETFNPGVSDACFATVEGVPTLCGMGPYGAAYHTYDEWLDVGQVAPRAALCAGLIAACAAQA